MAPISPEVSAAFKEQREAFHRKFGRDPGPDDPVFFDPDADTPEPLEMDPIRRLVVDAMVQAGTKPEVVYAFSKTGLIVTDMNQDNLSLEQLAEWDAAIAEYQEQTKGEDSVT